MRKLTDGQRRNAYELLYRRLVSYLGGGPKGCKATVGSRTEPGRQYEVEIATDRRGLYWRCGCLHWQHQPSAMCAHVGAAWLVWQAILRGEDANAEGAKPQARERYPSRPDVRRRDTADCS
jgi:hypothetical protein